jgi:16S rRNA (uracil1498-N3)-methyltransferase
MHLFYTPDIGSNGYMLNEQESKHAIRVLRLAIGNEVQLIDGKGGFYTAVIRDAHPKRCLLEVTETIKEFEKADVQLHMAVAPTKNNDRFEWFLEKATEMGIGTITPILCDHSERKVVKAERLEKILVSAMKQSVRAYLPELNKLKSVQDFVPLNFNGQKFIAHCEDGEKPLLKTAYQPGEDALILIGPEGDFSPSEIELAIKHGFQPISLGKSRLRTETAALAACHTINLLNQK